MKAGYETEPSKEEQIGDVVPDQDREPSGQAPVKEAVAERDHTISEQAPANKVEEETSAPEAKPSAPEAKPEAKPESEPEAKPESKPEAKPEAKFSCPPGLLLIGNGVCEEPKKGSVSSKVGAPTHPYEEAREETVKGTYKSSPSDADWKEGAGHNSVDEVAPVNYPFHL